MIKLKMPKDVRDYVLDVQAKKKKEKPGQFSQEQTIVAIIREHKEYAESVDKKHGSDRQESQSNY